MFFLTIFLILLNEDNYNRIWVAADDLENAKSEACGHTIDAAIDSLRGDGTITLFQGRNAFIFDPMTKEIVSFYDIRKNFHNIAVPLRAAAASRRNYSSNDFTLLAQGQQLYSYVNSTSGIEPKKGGNASLRAFDQTQRLPLAGNSPLPDCMAAMCEGMVTCHYWRIFNDYIFKSMHCVRGRDTAHCEYSKSIAPPKNIDPQIMDKLQTPCEAMAITYDPKEDETGLTYIDKDQLQYYVNNNHIYSMPINEIFCRSLLTNPLLWIFVAWIIGFFLIVTGSATFICISVKRKKSRRTFETTTCSTTECTNKVELLA